MGNIIKINIGLVLLALTSCETQYEFKRSDFIGRFELNNEKIYASIELSDNGEMVQHILFNGYQYDRDGKWFVDISSGVPRIGLRNACFIRANRITCTQGGSLNIQRCGLLDSEPDNPVVYQKTKCD